MTSANLGLSPVEFVNTIRVDHAVSLLRTTDLSVEAVAGQVGFRSANSLRTLIKRSRSMTIREIRGNRANA
ncbi:helix-turn-helix domain-containing protein [Streptomyces sp. NPDC001508]|uniref:helix-turn-helix domain-containing protein n=1 Tax=Streptomyces sp. NPDC001508 TaxID=3154656 RepID=UPI00331C93EE